MTKTYVCPYCKEEHEPTFMNPDDPRDRELCAEEAPCVGLCVMFVEENGKIIAIDQDEAGIL